MNCLLATSALLAVVVFTPPSVAHTAADVARVQYTQYLLGGELYCRTLESNGVYYSLEEHVFVAFLRGYILDRYVPQDQRYSQRGECPRIQWMKLGQVDEVTLDVTLLNDVEIISIWGYEISLETAVSLLQAEGFHVEFRGSSIYARK